MAQYSCTPNLLANGRRFGHQIGGNSPPLPAMPESSRIKRRLERRREASAEQDRSNRLIFIGIIAAFVVAIGVLLVKRWIESGPIDINRASAAQLETLPEIGPDLARAIVKGRPYQTIEDLEKVKGIGPATLKKIRERAVVKE